MGTYYYTAKMSNPIKTEEGFTVHKFSYMGKCSWSDSSREERIENAAYSRWDKAGKAPGLVVEIDEKGELCEGYNWMEGCYPLFVSTVPCWTDAVRGRHFVGVLHKREGCYTSVNFLSSWEEANRKYTR